MRVMRASNFTFPEQIRVLYDVYRFLFDLQMEYPSFRSWYVRKIVPGVIAGSRDLLITCEGTKLAGVAILKDGEEKKICTLRVAVDCRRHGVGSGLLDAAINVLGMEQPMITVADSRLHEFEPLFRSSGFRRVQNVSDYYRIGSQEICFNGYLRNPSCIAVPVWPSLQKSLCVM